MHDLLLDIGNSATRLSFHDGIGLRRIGRWTTADVDMDALARAIRTHDDHPASSPPAPARPVDASAVSGDGEGTSVTTGHPHPSGKDGNAECPRIWMACVVPALGDVLESSPSWTGGRLLRRLRSTDPEWPPHALATPETTGVDRRLAAWAAAAMAGLSGGDAPVFLDTPRSLETPSDNTAPPGHPVDTEAGGGDDASFRADARRSGVVVVQAGTAATVDWVDASGVFRGGMILPGPGLWRRGLSRAAQLFPDPDAPVDWTAASRPLGEGTEAALSAGLAAGLSGAVGHAVASLAREAAERSGEPDPRRAPPLVLTGGWAEGLWTAWRHGMFMGMGPEKASPAWCRLWRRTDDLVTRGLHLFASHGRTSGGRSAH